MKKIILTATLLSFTAMTPLFAAAGEAKPEAATEATSPKESETHKKFATAAEACDKAAEKAQKAKTDDLSAPLKLEIQLLEDKITAEKKFLDAAKDLPENDLKMLKRTDKHVSDECVKAESEIEHTVAHHKKMMEKAAKKAAKEAAKEAKDAAKKAKKG
jgi:hypothetical protein